MWTSRPTARRERRQLGYTDGSDHQLFPGMFWLSFIESSAVRPVTSVAADAQRTDYVLNIASHEYALAAMQCLRESEEEAARSRRVRHARAPCSIVWGRRSTFSMCIPRCQLTVRGGVCTWPFRRPTRAPGLPTTRRCPSIGARDRWSYSNTMWSPPSTTRPCTTGACSSIPRSASARRTTGEPRAPRACSGIRPQHPRDPRGRNVHGGPL